MAITISEATQIQWTGSPMQELECIRHVALPESLYKCISDTDTPAIRSTMDGIEPLTHKALQQFLCGVGNLQGRGIGPQDVVGIVMPNGPELATALITCMSQCIAAPVDPAMTSQEFISAFQQMGVKYVIALQDHRAVGDATLDRACKDTPCELHYIISDAQAATTGVFRWVMPFEHNAPKPPPRFLRAHDTALVLRTSGTTSKPKVVPLTVEGLYTGAICIGKGLALTSSDICLNVMPYTHIGGISCNLLATLFCGGGSVICAAAFDPICFLEWLEKLEPTWYYAVPTIHKAVCLCAKASGNMKQHCLRLIRSGAAHLSDADARELREIFKCRVLPTYSMTECMPIAQPPLDYDLTKPGTVGVPIASSMRIVDGCGNAVQFGQVGEVAIKGPVVTHGYLDDVAANEACFFGEGDVFPDGRWFRTGDVGYLDEDGFVFLTGRSKELIKRGGEQVSPYEVEEVLLSHEAVQLAVVFGVPNDFWGEEVAAAVEFKDEATGKVTTGKLIQFIAQKLPSSKVPRQIIAVNSASDLPKTRTGKYIRAGLATHLGVEAVDLSAMTSLSQTPNSARQDSKRLLKPHKSIYGLRYLFAVWVVFVHFGPNSPTWLSTVKGYSFSMPGYFLLAGFLLASSSSEPIDSKLQFYKHRIVAAHPLYLLSALFSLPLTFLMCPPGRTGISTQFQQSCGYLNTGVTHPAGAAPPLQGNYWVQILYSLVNVFFGQLAWPWGVPALFLGFVNGVMWFSSAYYFCLLCFPFFYNWMNSRCLLGRYPSKYLVRPFCIRFLLWPVGFFFAVSSAITYAGWKLAPLPIRWFGGFIKDPVLKYMIQGPNEPGMNGVAGFFGYTFPVTWACIFFLGMLLAKLFELNRSGSGIYEWPHWGKLTDLTSVLLFLSLATGPLLWWLDPKYNYFTYSGIQVPLPNAPATEIAQWWGGDNFNGCKFVDFLLCFWIYGLAVGKGFTAKVLGCNFVVQYLSPAAYSVYLFQFPTAYYWFIFKLKVLHTSYTAMMGAKEPLAQALIDYFMIVFLTTLIAMLAAHKINAPLTSCFLRIVDFACCCGRSPVDARMTTFDKVAAAVKGLSGTTVDESTLIAECGLDSFGTGALLGMLKSKFQLLTVTPLEVYKLQTVGDLVKRIDRDLNNAGCTSADTGSFREQMAQPLAAPDSCGV